MSTSENELFIADGINNNILIFDFYGKTIRNFSLDDDNDCTGHIHGITVSKNRIYVVKENNDCVAIYDLSGKLLEKFSSFLSCESLSTTMISCLALGLNFINDSKQLDKEVQLL